MSDGGTGSNTTPPERRFSGSYRPKSASGNKPDSSGGATLPPAAPRPGQRKTTSKAAPTMPRNGSSGDQRRSPLAVALGSIFIVALVILAFAGGRIFGRAPEPTATPVATVIASISTPDNVEEPAPTPAGPHPVVCLDPGHGGEDRGFSRAFLGLEPPLEEASVNLRQAWELRERLQARGIEVVMTREADQQANPEFKDINGDKKTAADDRGREHKYYDLDELQARINICNAAEADLLVSMHINGYSTQKPYGYETWYTAERPFGEKSQVFATLAYAHFKEQLRNIGYVVAPEDERGVNPDHVADVQKEHTTYKHYVLTGPEIPGSIKPSEMPGAIVEGLFISNDTDAAILASDEGTNAIVTAYENAIVEYFERYPVEDTP